MAPSFSEPSFSDWMAFLRPKLPFFILIFFINLAIKRKLKKRSSIRRFHKFKFILATLFQLYTIVLREPRTGIDVQLRDMYVGLLVYKLIKFIVYLIFD